MPYQENTENGHAVLTSEPSRDEYGRDQQTFESGTVDESTDTDTLEELGLEQVRHDTDAPDDGSSADEFSPMEDEGDGDFDFGEDFSDNEDGDFGLTATEHKVSIIDEDKVPEAFAASYPEETVVREVVLGRDDRRRVRDTRPFPYRAIVQLSIEAKNGRRYVGTGWLISPRTVITAGHCVYLHGAGGWAKSITVTPGMNGSSRPYGSCKATAFRSVSGWVRKKSRDYDYGAIILPKSHPLGRKTGVFRFATVSNSVLLRKYVNISGYPGDKGGKTQWYHARRISRITSKRLTYMIDTAGGQSGSPVFYRRGSSRVAVGIHTSGSMSGNAGTRINASVKTNLTRWGREGR